MILLWLLTFFQVLNLFRKKTTTETVCIFSTITKTNKLSLWNSIRGFLLHFTCWPFGRSGVVFNQLTPLSISLAYLTYSWQNISFVYWWGFGFSTTYTLWICLANSDNVTFRWQMIQCISRLSLKVAIEHLAMTFFLIIEVLPWN